MPILDRDRGETINKSVVKPHGSLVDLLESQSISGYIWVYLGISGCIWVDDHIGLRYPVLQISTVRREARRQNCELLMNSGE